MYLSMHDAIAGSFNAIPNDSLTGSFTNNVNSLSERVISGLFSFLFFGLGPDSFLWILEIFLLTRHVILSLPCKLINTSRDLLLLLCKEKTLDTDTRFVFDANL